MQVASKLKLSPDPAEVPRSADALSADAQACQQTLCGGSKSFHAASLLLPKAFAADATALYAFCRLTDDLIDNAVESAGKEEFRGDNGSDKCDSTLDPKRAAQRVMQSLFDRLDRLYSGQPYPHPADRALVTVVQRHQLPKSLLLSLFEGFEWDASERKYQTIEDVYAYGARVAGTVGVMMSVLMGVRDTHLTARAADLGVAMQLTNIARDVGEDARAGRLYLPRNWLREVGVDPEQFLATPVFSPELGQVTSRLLDAADILYSRADSGIALLPRRVRAGMYAARLLYSEIGSEIRRLDYNSVDQRAVVSPLGKARVLTKLAKLPFLGTKHLQMGALEETNYLVNVIASQPGATPSTAKLLRNRSLNPWGGMSAQAGRVIDLFEELNKRDAERAVVRSKAKASAQ